jgi:hypothetical protein
MSILETLASLATAKAVAAAAATTLAVGGAAGLSIANEAVGETPAEVEVPAGEAADNRADNADLGSGNAENAADIELTLDEVEAELDAENEGRAADVHEVLGDGEGADFGQNVAENAREGAGGEFGRAVAEAASQGASGEGRARAEEARENAGNGSTDVEDNDRRDEAKDRRPDTPAAEDRPAETPAEGEGSESSVDGRDTAETAPHGQADGRRP